MRNDYLEAVSDELFARTPSALLEIFVLLQQNPEVKGVRASTIRAVNKNLWLIDEEFRQNPRNHRLFLEILRAPAGVTHELRRMNTYGVLGRYIPAFGRIVGRMQYDLFHAYTVDAHTLFVLSNLRRLSLPKYDGELPNLSAIMQQLPKLEIAYLAALFHDIAKGRGGDHSQLGAVDAEAFCLEQGLSRYDARLVAWLVQNHLELSVTAQKQDISDPEVINAFARRVGDETHLDYLYVLTSADVRGTNPKLWNSWKASLFQEFYERVKRALRRGLESPIDPDELMRETQDGARKLLAASGRITPPEISRAWERLTAAYFLRHTPEEVAWHTQLLADREPGSEDPLVAVQSSSERGTTAILAFAPHRYNSFAHHHGGARPARPQHRRRAHHADGRRLQPRPVPRARGGRRAHRRQRTHRGDRARAVARAAAPGRSAGHGHAARAAPGAHVPHRHADRRQRRRAQPALGARAHRRATGRACCATSARCSWKNASTCWPRRS